MTASLSLFPARVRFTNTDGTLTNEAYRALQALFIRVGGSLGNFDFDTLTLAGNATINGKLILSDGAVTAPSLYWGANTSTGFYRIGTNNVGYTVNGSQVLNLLSTGLTVTGTTTSTSFTGAGTGLTGTAASLTAGNVTTNANLTGMVTSVGNATTVVTNANLTGMVTSVGNATTVVTNANLTGMVTSVGNATTVVTNANLTGPITSVGNATSVAAQTGTGSTFVMNTSPTLVTPALGAATATSIQSPIGTVTPNTGAFTTVSTTGTLTTPGGASFHTTNTALTNGAGVALGTLMTAPVAGNPTKWIGINDNGTIRYIPAW